jgi:hypothetical protein
MTNNGLKGLFTGDKRERVLTRFLPGSSFFINDALFKYISAIITTVK